MSDQALYDTLLRARENARANDWPGDVKRLQDHIDAVFPSNLERESPQKLELAAFRMWKSARLFRHPEYNEAQFTLDAFRREYLSRREHWIGMAQAALTSEPKP